MTVEEILADYQDLETASAGICWRAWRSPREVKAQLENVPDPRLPADGGVPIMSVPAIALTENVRVKRSEVCNADD